MTLLKTIFSAAILTLLLSENKLFAAGVPEELFGVQLGTSYGLNNNFRELPQKTFIGLRKGVGQGIHYFFQPKIHDPQFIFKKKKSANADNVFEASFKLYLLPTRQLNLLKATQSQLFSMPWEVVAIDWSDDLATNTVAYEWARNLCQQYSIKYQLNPEITDFPDSDWYECHFITGNRALNIGGMAKRVHITLSFQAETLIAKEKAIGKNHIAQ